MTGRPLREMTTGERLRCLRESRGLSQNKLARLTELSAAAIYLLESGKRQNMTSDTAERLAAALDVSVPLLRYGWEPAPTDAEGISIRAALRGRNLAEEDVQRVIDYIEAIEARRRLAQLEDT